MSFIVVLPTLFIVEKDGPLPPLVWTSAGHPVFGALAFARLPPLSAGGTVSGPGQSPAISVSSVFFHIVCTKGSLNN